jgi:hypothetical protein
VSELLAWSSQFPLVLVAAVLALAFGLVGGLLALLAILCWSKPTQGDEG